MKPRRLVIWLGATLCAIAATPVAAATDPVLFVGGLQGASGSAIEPGGALYVTEGALGRILRVDSQTAEVTTFATGLPPPPPTARAVRRPRLPAASECQRTPARSR